MITAPIMAPYGWPAPPSTAAAMIGIRNAAPLATANESEFRAATTPAKPHNAPVISQTTSTTRWVGMPQLRASVGLADVARIALPSFVYVRSPWIRSMTTTARPMIAIWLVVSVMLPIRTRLPPVFWYEELKAPTIGSSRLAIMSDTASETMTIPM